MARCVLFRGALLLPTSSSYYAWCSAGAESVGAREFDEDLRTDPDDESQLG